MAPQNWETASWLEERPILYKSAMHNMELPVANLKIATTTFTWTGMAKRNLVSCLCKSGVRVVHKYSKVETSICMRPLNSLALNEPKRFWSKNPGLCNPRSWAHKRRCCLSLHDFNPCIASVKPICWACHSKTFSFSLDMLFMVANKESSKTSKIKSLWTSGSIFSTTLVLNLRVQLGAEKRKNFFFRALLLKRPLECRPGCREQSCEEASQQLRLGRLRSRQWGPLRPHGTPPRPS